MEPSRRFQIIQNAKKEKPIDHLYNRTIKDNPPPIVEPRLSYGFEVNTEPKLIGLLYDEDPKKRLTSLQLLYDHCANHEKIIRVIQFNGIDPLIKLLFDAEKLIRQHSAALLSRISVIHSGVKAILEHDNGFEKILEILSDQEPTVCFSVHSIVLHICSSILVEKAVNRGVIPELIKSLTQICPEALNIALSSLSYCTERLESAIHIALTEGVVPVLNILFRVVEDDGPLKMPLVIEKASALLAVLCGHVDGKKEAIAHNCINYLVDILKKTDDIQTQMIVVEAMMTITTDLDGQRQALTKGFCEILINLLKREDPTLRINTIKCISNMAVNPSGREALQPSLKDLELYENDPNISISESAQEAVVRVKWIP